MTTKPDRLAYAGGIAAAVSGLVAMIVRGVDALTSAIALAAGIVTVVAIVFLIRARRRGALAEGPMWSAIVVVTIVVIVALWVAGDVRRD